MQIINANDNFKNAEKNDLGIISHLILKPP